MRRRPVRAGDNRCGCPAGQLFLQRIESGFVFIQFGFQLAGARCLLLQGGIGAGAEVRCSVAISSTA